MTRPKAPSWCLPTRPASSSTPPAKACPGWPPCPSTRATSSWPPSTGRPTPRARRQCAVSSRERPPPSSSGRRPRWPTAGASPGTTRCLRRRRSTCSAWARQDSGSWPAHTATSRRPRSIRTATCSATYRTSRWPAWSEWSTHHEPSPRSRLPTPSPRTSGCGWSPATTWSPGRPSPSNSRSPASPSSGRSSLRSRRRSAWRGSTTSAWWVGSPPSTRSCWRRRSRRRATWSP